MGIYEGRMSEEKATVRLTATEFARIAKALADPQRCEILELAATKGDLSCTAFFASFPVSQATVSHHLKELATAGLLDRRKDGQFAYYRYQPDTMAAYQAELSRRMDRSPYSDPTHRDDDTDPRTKDRKKESIMASSKNVLDIDDSNFETEVLKAKEPVLVDFGATWCGPCKALAPIVDKIADENVGKYKVVKVDIDDAPGVAKKYGIRGVPTVVVFKDGVIKGQHVGLTNKETLLKLFDA
jgi:thioredoxin 1